MALLASAKITPLAKNERMQRMKRKTDMCVQDSSMTSWPDHLLSGNQKRFWRDP